MAIYNNICTEIGDILYFEELIPIMGLTSLISYIDVIDGQTSDRYFKKEFQYSLDGINFSSWQDLTDFNLTQISIQPSDYFCIKYKYTRIGVDNTGDLIFENITLNGTFIDLSCGDSFNNSIFAEFINCPDSEVLGWCINVTKKLYYKGIVPNYILRRVDQNSNNDKDYLDFWKTIACFFAMIVIYGRRILEDFRNYDQLTELYLKQRNLFLNNKTSLEDLNYLINNYYDEIRQRGTAQIYKEKNLTQFNTTSISHTKSNFDKKIDGELLRIISYTKFDEFIFNLVKKESIGWTINRSSPLFKGLSSQRTINKAYEDSGDILDLNKYPLFNLDKILLENDYEENKKVLKIFGVELNSKSGIGPSNYPNINEEDLAKSIKVNENLDYQITFWLKTPYFDESDSDSISNSSIDYSLHTKITFGVVGLDEENNIIDFLNVTDNSIQNNFFVEKTLIKGDIYFFIRGIIYNKNKGIISSDNSILNIGFGNNLKFSPNIIKIIPVIFSVVPLSHAFTPLNCLYIWDLQVKPLNTPFSTGFIQIKNFIEIWLENNNLNLTEDQIKEIMRKYLLPYNCTFKNIYIGDNYDYSESISNSLSESVPLIYS